MNLIKQLERRLGRFAIPNLTLFLVGGQGIALFMSIALPGSLGTVVLIPDLVLSGEWWRLLSFVFTPPFGNPIFAVFALYLLYFMGTSLEAQWGTFRYNLYVLIGCLMTIAAAFVFPHYAASNTYITGSIFLAFAYLFPDYTIYLFFVLPVRIKWLALLTGLFYGYDLIIGDWASRLLIIAAVANFFMFFGKDIYHRARYGHRRLKQQSISIVNRNKPIHVCTVCGITDKSHPTMDFRYCGKCEPPVAYCTEHLTGHAHRNADAGS